MIKKVLTQTCCMFTVSVFLFVSFLAALGEVNTTKFTSSRLFILLLFSFIIALANRIFDIKKLHLAIKVVVHYIVCFLDMYLCVFVIFYRTSGMDQHTDYTPAQILVASILFTVIYVVVITIKLIAEKIKSKKKTNVPYTKQFKEIK